MSPLAWGCHNNSQTNLLRWWFVVITLQRRIIPISCQYQVLLTHSPSSFYLLFSPFLSFSILDWFQINLNYNFISSTALYFQLDICRHTRRLWSPFFLFSGSIFVVTRGDRACPSFLFPYRSSWAHEEIVIAFIFLFWIDLCGHTRRLRLPLFSVSGSISVDTRGDLAWLYLSFLERYLWAHGEIMLAILFCFRIDLRSHTKRSWLPFFSVSGSIFVLWRSRQIFPFWHMWLACLPFFNSLGGIISPDIFSYWSAITVLSEYEVSCDEVSVSPIHKIAPMSFSCWTLVLLLRRSLWTMDMINLVNIDVLST